MRVDETKQGESEKDHIFKHGMGVLFLFHLGSVANLIFQFVTGRALSKGEYGILYSMLGLMLVFMIPMRALQTTMSHFTGQLKKENRRGDILRLVNLWEKKLLMVGFPLLIVLIGLSFALAPRFHLPSAWPLILVFASVFLFAFLQVYVGVFQGVQSFVWMCVTSNGWSIVRLAAAFILVILIAPLAVSGLASHLIGNIAIVGTALYILRRRFRGSNCSPLQLEATDRYFILSALALLAFSVMMNGDVVLVKIFFKKEIDYGDYARASAIGRMIVFLIQPLAMALFPKVVAKGTATKAHKKTFLRALLLSGGLIAIAAGFCAAFPQIPLRIVFGDIQSDARSADILRLISAGMAPLGLAFMILNYELAQHRFRFMIPLTLCALLFVGGVSLYHQSIWNVAYILCFAGYTTLALLLWDTLVPNHNHLLSVARRLTRM